MAGWMNSAKSKVKAFLGIYQQRQEEAIEEDKLLAEGQAMDVLVHSPAWELLMGHLEEQDEAALNELGKVNMEDAWACQSALIQFRSARKMLRDLESYVHGLIIQKREIEARRKEEAGTTAVTFEEAMRDYGNDSTATH